MSGRLRTLIVAVLAATCAAAVGLVPSWEQSLHAQSYFQPGGAVGTEALHDAEHERKTLAQRLQAAREGTGRPIWGVFATFERDTLDRDRSRSSGGFDSSTPGGFIGVDRRFSDALLVGAALGFKVTDFDGDRPPPDFDGTRGPESQRTYSETLGPYVSYSPTQPWYVNASLLLGLLQVQTERSGADTGLRAAAHGHTWGHRFSIAADGGYDWRHRALTVGPHASIAYDHVTVEGYDEHGRQGDRGELLHFADRNDELVTVRTGPHVSYVTRLSWATIIPHARFDFVYRDASRPGSKVSFLDTPHHSFTLPDPPQDSTSIEAGVGFQLILPDDFACWIDFEMGFLEEDVDRTQLTAGIRKEF